MRLHRFFLLFAPAAALLLASAARAEAVASEAAQARLSAAYSATWRVLPAEQRTEFAARERDWLAVGRWQEQRACMGREADAAQADACLAQVIERRARALEAQTGAQSTPLASR